MKKKVIGIVIICIMITGGFSSLVAAENTRLNAAEKIDIQSEKTENCFETIMSFDNETQVSTVGPIVPVINIAEIIIIDGPFLKTFIIRLILTSTKAYFLLPNISLNIKDMTLAVIYKRNVPNIPFLQKFSYNTTVTENGNKNSFTKKHMLIVSGFEGTFGFSRAKPLQLTPPSFRFKGTCEGIIVAT